MESGSSRKTPYLIGFVIGVLVCMMIAMGFINYLGIKKILSKTAAADSAATATSESHEFSGDTAIDESTLQKIKIVEEAINENYYKTDIDRDAEAVSIYKGIVSSLGDPYSEYYTEEEYQDLMSDTKGIYYGIGAYVSMDKETNLPRITATIPDSPAEKVGLLGNDIIYKVDGNLTQGLTLSEVVGLIRGEIGTTVKVTVFRESVGDYIDYDVVRDKVESQTVNASMMDDEIGYIGITEFDSVTTNQFMNGLQELKDQNMKGLIIDLRSNPGGSLSAVCEIAEQLLPEGVIVYTVDRDGNREDYTCDGANEIDIPMVVLVNGYSASASEILSGAIKDYKKGTIVGETTYGKGVVQRIFPFEDGTAVKLTISNYYTPNGNNINGIGIEPDVEIKLDTEALSKDGSDNQVDKAKEILREKMK
ncbi:S41 family peptidase [Butyrivibrio sp. AE3006]|uniref:S41 family peptidase n=1 Tax=Butyrivibrio sp. AE3006 TaxID=1280673 RepID=UPI00041D6C80|nr:S41 family peptidase [Butyrivibrio sp. AE3006]